MRTTLWDRCRHCGCPERQAGSWEGVVQFQKDPRKGRPLASAVFGERFLLLDMRQP